MRYILLFHVFCLFASSYAQFGPFEQDFGYVEVRDGAHMFWWMFYTTAEVENYTERPLIVWLQGGPGGSSTGYGNFEMIGPMDLNLAERNTSWVKNFNLMFIDNPVGTGFSYVEDNNLLARDNEQIGIDLVSLMQGFYERHREFETVPFYIFGQSYGGKMAVDFSIQLDRAIKDERIASNFGGFAMGNAWISPIDITLTWAPFLRTVGLLDESGHDAVMEAAHVMEDHFNDGNFTESSEWWRRTQIVVSQRTNGVDFYNILTKYESPAQTRSDNDRIVDMLTFSKHFSRNAWNLDELMNTQVKLALNIPEDLVWQSSSNTVFNTLSEDFMKPVTEGIEQLLNNTNITVMVYNGNLDLICDTPGQIVWLDRLQWPGAEGFRLSPRRPVWENNVLEGYFKSFANFRFYWVNEAGHSAPLDNPAAAVAYLRDMTSFG